MYVLVTSSLHRQLIDSFHFLHDLDHLPNSANVMWKATRCVVKMGFFTPCILGSMATFCISTDAIISPFSESCIQIGKYFVSFDDLRIWDMFGIHQQHMLFPSPLHSKLNLLLYLAHLSNGLQTQLSFLFA